MSKKVLIAYANEPMKYSLMFLKFQARWSGVFDKVITYSGLSGIVSEVMEDRVILKVYPNMTEVSIEKWAIAGLDDREIDEPKKEEK